MGWLSLNRRIEEELIYIVPPSAEPTVVRVKVLRTGSNTRLGTLAPTSVDIVRGENYGKKKQ